MVRERTHFCPSAVSLPQDARGGWTPMPMKARVASARMAPGMPRVTATMMGPIPFGSRCRVTMLRSLTPMARAASTNSVSLSASSCPRTRRATAPSDDADGYEDEQHPVHGLPDERLAQGHVEQDDEQQVREGVHHVGEAHQQGVGAATEPGRRGADRQADQEHHALDHEGHRHADLRSVQQPAEQVTTEVIGAQKGRREGGDGPVVVGGDGSVRFCCWYGNGAMNGPMMPAA